MSLFKKKVLVIGLGKSGLSVSRWLSDEGAKVTVSDMKEKEALNKDLVNEVLKLGVTLETGGHKLETFLNSDMIVVSPGVPLDLEALATSREKGIPVLGEMELAGRHIDIPIVAITGTNGKSTTTSLLGDMLKNAGFRVFVGLGIKVIHTQRSGDDAGFP